MSVMVPNRVILVDKVQLDMFDSDIIWNMYWLHACFSSIDYRTSIVKFQLPNEPIREWNGGKSMRRGQIISFMKSCKITANGCL